MNFDNQNGSQIPLPPPSPARLRRRSVSRLVLYTLLHIIISLIATFLVTTVFTIALMSPLPADGSFNEMTAAAEELVFEHIGTITYVSLICSSLISAAVYMLFIRRQRDSYPPLTAKQPASLVVLPFAVLCTMSACLFVGMVLNWLMAYLPEGTQSSSLDNISAHPLLVFIGVVVLGPIAEELVFRTLCLRNLNGAFSFRVANVLQALLFGLTHLVPLQVAYAFAFGLLLGWLYDRTGRIVIPIVSHMAFNFIGALSLLIPPDAEESAEAAAESGGVSALLFALFMLGATISLILRITSMTEKYSVPKEASAPSDVG